jgi:hypothetical protein
LSTDGFQPHSIDSHPYSCWPIFVMPYNLPPDKCLKEGFIFLALVIPSPKEPKKQMNIFLQPLFEELKNLWSGVDAYDSHLKCRFNLCVAYLWSIHDYFGYGKFADWCVHSRLNYPICMDDSDAYRLEHSKKDTFFDCHRRFLPLSHPFRGDRKSFMKGKTVKKGHQSENSELISHKCLMILRSKEMVSLKVTVRITTGLIKVVFGNSLMQRP